MAFTSVEPVQGFTEALN